MSLKTQKERVREFPGWWTRTLPYASVQDPKPNRDRSSFDQGFTLHVFSSGCWFTSFNLFHNKPVNSNEYTGFLSSVNHSSKWIELRKFSWEPLIYRPVRSTFNNLDLELAAAAHGHLQDGVLHLSMWPSLQVDSVRIELHCRTPNWFWRAARWCETTTTSPQHTGNGTRIILPGDRMPLWGPSPWGGNNAEAFPLWSGFSKFCGFLGINQAKPLPTAHATYHCVNITISCHL